MKFTTTEARSIASTMDKLSAIAFTAWDRESTDGANARAIAYVVAELRVCAELMASGDRATRLAAADRMAALITQ